MFVDELQRRVYDFHGYVGRIVRIDNIEDKTMPSASNQILWVFLRCPSATVS